MSLQTLFQNYFTVATSINAGQDTEGAVDRDYQIQVLNGYINRRGAFQAISKKDVMEIYGKKEDVTLIRLFHNLRELEITTATFIVSHKNPLIRVSNFSDRENLIVYQYVGQRDPVMHKTRNVPLEIFLERNHRWNIG